MRVTLLVLEFTTPTEPTQTLPFKACKSKKVDNFAVYRVYSSPGIIKIWFLGEELINMKYNVTNL